MGELERMGGEICLDKAWAARKESSAVKATKRSGERRNAPPMNRVCDDYEKDYQDTTLRHNDVIAQEIAGRADAERERATRSSTIVLPSPLAGKPASFDASDMYLGFRKAATAGWKGYGEQREGNGTGR